MDEHREITMTVKELNASKESYWVKQLSGNLRELDWRDIDNLVDVDEGLVITVYESSFEDVMARDLFGRALSDYPDYPVIGVNQIKLGWVDIDMGLYKNGMRGGDTSPMPINQMVSVLKL